MLAHISGGSSSVAQWCLLFSLLPVLVLAQASKTSQISSATKALSTLGAPTASPFCTSYIGGKPTSYVTVRQTGVYTTSVVATSTLTLPTGEPRRSVTVRGTTTATTTTTWTRATVYPETEDVYTTQTLTQIDPEYTQELAGLSTSQPKTTTTSVVTLPYNQLPDSYFRKKRQNASPAVPSPLTRFPASILSSACSTYLGTATSTFTHSFFTATSTLTASTRVVTSTPPPVTETRWTTTTRRALVTTTAQATATRVNVDSETQVQYSGTVTTVNPDLLTTVLLDATSTIYTSISPPEVTERVALNFDTPPGNAVLRNYGGLRWDQNPFLSNDGNIPAFSAPNTLRVDTRNRLGPRMYTDKGTADLRLLSLKCRWWIYNSSPLQVVGVRAGVEQYSIDLNCVRGGQDSNNNYYGTFLPFVDSIYFRSPGGAGGTSSGSFFIGGIDDVVVDFIKR